MSRNKKWLKVETKELYNFTMWVTSSPADLKKETVQAVETFLQRHIIDYE